MTEADSGLPMDMPEQLSPAAINPPAKVHRCKFCRSALPINSGAEAWRICDECWLTTEFET